MGKGSLRLRPHINSWALVWGSCKITGAPVVITGTPTVSMKGRRDGLLVQHAYAMR